MFVLKGFRDMSKAIRFAVMGDTHYVQPASHRNVLEYGVQRGPTDLDDVRRHQWMTKAVVPEVIRSIAKLRPDFVLHTGDIIQGHHDSEEAGGREAAEAVELLKGLNAPVFLTLGTHDGTPESVTVKEHFLPAIGDSLGEKNPRTYYSFSTGDTLFIALDYTTFRADSQQGRFIKETLSNADKYRHVFVFAHPPIFPVGRPFFADFEFSSFLKEEFMKNRIDAYFCGHTHNQVASIHGIGGYYLPQLKSTILGYPDQSPISLTDVRPILKGPTDFHYLWGFLEDSAPSWWMVTVTGELVRAEWHVLGMGVQSVLIFGDGQMPKVMQEPALGQSTILPLPSVSQIRSARLRAAGSGCRTKELYRVHLNGEEIGYLPTLDYFDCRQFLEIPESYWHLLKDSNDLEVSCGSEPMCVGGFVLEIETQDGSWVRSKPTFHYYGNTSRWSRWQTENLQVIGCREPIRVKLEFAEPA